LAFRGGERTEGKFGVVEAFNYYEWVGGELVIGGCERLPIAAAFGSIAD